MGAYQNNGDVTKKGGKKRGTVRNDDRLAAFSREVGGGGASWGELDPGRLQAVIVAITTMGGAVTFGLSRDMGAHSLTLLLDGNRKSFWYNGDADLDDELHLIVTTLDQMAEE